MLIRATIKVFPYGCPFYLEWGRNMRILYVGEHTAINLTKNEFDISFDRTPIELLNIRNIVSEYNILIIEISPEKIDTILKWVFKLYCEKKIPILAVLHDCSSADKILLNQFGISDYIDDYCIVHQLEEKLNIIANKIKWGKI